jgi:hypothetical protein
MVLLLCSMFAMQCPQPSLDSNKQQIYFKNLLSIESPSIRFYTKNSSTYQQIPLLIIKKHEKSN